MHRPDLVAACVTHRPDLVAACVMHRPDLVAACVMHRPDFALCARTPRLCPPCLCVTLSLHPRQAARLKEKKERVAELEETKLPALKTEYDLVRETGVTGPVAERPFITRLVFFFS